MYLCIVPCFLLWPLLLIRSRESASFSKPELKKSRSRTDLVRQLSKQLSIQEPDEEVPKQKTILIQEEKAEIGMVQIVLREISGAGTQHTCDLINTSSCQNHVCIYVL